MRDLLTRHGPFYFTVVIIYTMLLPIIGSHVRINMISVLFLSCLVYESVNFMHISNYHIKYSFYGSLLQAAFPFLLFIAMPIYNTWILIAMSVAVIGLSVVGDLFASRQLILNYSFIRGMAVYVLLIVLVLSQIIQPESVESVSPMISNAIDDSTKSITMSI